MTTCRTTPPGACFSVLFGLGFLLDSGTFDFLIVPWIMDDGGNIYNKTLANRLYHNTLEQQAPPSDTVNMRGKGRHPQPGTMRLEPGRLHFPLK